MARSTKPPKPPTKAPAEDPKGYRHKEEAAARPEVGAAPRFKAKKEAATYRYDSSLSPALDWDEQPARDIAAWLLKQIEEAASLPGQTFPQPRVLSGADGKPLMTVAGLQDALAALKAMQKPFLNWAGKAERLSFDVPTLPLFIHERLSTEAIIKTLEGHRKVPEQSDLFSLFSDERMPMAKQVDAYAYRNGWVNRMVLGDSLAVMNSLLRYDGLGGQVQMIYMDPPYGVKFGSNFQPFVRDPKVKHGDDEDMTREPEMVQAYRDTWQLGLHSYLTYLRDRLLVAKDLLTPSGSIFVQISDSNLHHVRQILDEIFGAENFCKVIAFTKTTGLGSDLLPDRCDYLLWYARDRERLKVRKVYRRKVLGEEGATQYDWCMLPDGTYRRLEAGETPPEGARLFHPDNMSAFLTTPHLALPYTFRGTEVRPPANCQWKTHQEGLSRLDRANRLMLIGKTLRYLRYLDDFPVAEYSALWTDTGISGFSDPKLYVVQTNTKVIERCIMMTTDPGDVVLDPTCGSGSTAWAAEKWGRRWITIDTSRVPLALARQRVLTSTFPWFKLRDAESGPAGGFVYERKQNRKGEEIGGIVPHVTLGSIANNEVSEEVVLFDSPEVTRDVTRVAGPFVVEAVLPTPQPLEGDSVDAPQDMPSDHIARMIEVLRRSPNLRLPGGGDRVVRLKNIRRPGKSLNLSAEAVVDHDASGAAVLLGAAVDAAHEKNTGGLPFSSKPVAILFGPPNGAVTAKAVLDAAKEANVKGYAHLYVIGFLFTAEARAELMAGEAGLGLPASPVEMTHDVMMGDLLKTQRSSQIFAITGSPEIAVQRLAENAEDGTPRWQIRLMGLDTFDPAAIKPHHLNGDDVPMWMLDIAWNGMAFCAHQVFFPRTKAWESLRKVFNATHEASVWEHLAGDLSAPFAAPIGTEIAVKVLDDRGNELLKVHRLGAESA
jgi:adenine-specific DNA-methyltransferase